MTVGDSPVIRTDGTKPHGARRVGTFDGQLSWAKSPKAWCWSTSTSMPFASYLSAPDVSVRV